MDLKLAGLNAVVTGGSAGIGAAIVRAFAGEGCNVSFCSRKQEHVDSLLKSVESLPGAVHGRVVDVTDADGFKAWLGELGSVDIFVPNVSTISGDWEVSFRTDIQATVTNTEAVVPFLQRSSCGAVTYVGSRAASIAMPGFEAYSASKAAMAHYMKSLSVRLLPAVRVNVVSPGDTLCGSQESWRASNPEAYERAVQSAPMKRYAQPEEIARVVVFISSPAASFVAGANWYVDGSWARHVQF